MTIQAARDAASRHGGYGTQVSSTPASTETTLRFQVRLSPEASMPGFYARVSGARLSTPVEFSSKAAFVEYLERVAVEGAGSPR